MKNGQLTDVQRPSFGFRYSFGESHGFSGTEETQLISDTIIAQDLGPQGALVIAGFTCPCSGREMSTNVAKCIQMYTYVAPISVSWDAILRLTEQVLAVPEGYREDDLGAFRSVSADRFHLQVLFGREQWLFSSCALNVHNVGPPRVLFGFRQPFEALSEFDAIILG